MTIRKYTKDIELTVGKWITLDSMVTHAFAGKAAVIKDLKPSSVVVDTFVERDSGEFDDEVNVLKRKSSITFVCDSQQEAFAIRAKSREFTNQALDAENELKLKLEKLKEGFIQEVIG